MRGALAIVSGGTTEPSAPLSSPSEAPRRLPDALDIPALYRRYGDLVLGRCRTILRDDADAQDAMQEVFLKLHRFSESFRGESSPSTFLYRVTTTTCHCLHASPPLATTTAITTTTNATGGV